MIKKSIDFLLLTIAFVFFSQGFSLAAIETVAGDISKGVKTPGSDQSHLNLPQRVAVDSDGIVYVADTYNNRICRIDGSLPLPTETATSANLIPVITSGLNKPTGMVFDADGNLYVVAVSANNLLTNPNLYLSVLKIGRTDGELDENIRTVLLEDTIYGTDPDSFKTPLSLPEGLAFGPDGSLYVANSTKNNVIRLVGDGSGGFSEVQTIGPFSGPKGVAVDAEGNLYVAAAAAAAHCIYKVPFSGGVFSSPEVYAGVPGAKTVAPDDANPVDRLSVNFNAPFDLSFDGAGNLFVADVINNRIRKIGHADGMVTTVAGTTSFSYSWDPPTYLNMPYGVAVHSASGGSDVYIADTRNSRIARIFEPDVAVANLPPEAFYNTVSVPEDTELNITLTGTDPDGTITAWNWSSAANTNPDYKTPDHGYLSGGGKTPVYIPDINFNGTDTFTFTVTDDKGVESALATVTINVTPVNDPPTIGYAISPLPTVKQGVAYTVDANGNDIDFDTLAYVIENQPSWTTFDASTGVLSGTPANGDVGLYSAVRIGVFDGTVTTWLNPFSVEVLNVNDTPTLSIPLVDALATQDVDFTYTFSESTFADIDGDPLSHSAAGLPGWLAYNAVSLTFSGRPGNSDVGSFDITVTATDPGGEFVQDTFQVTVANVNDAPTVDAGGIPSLTVDEDQLFSYDVAGYFSDIDAGTSLTYSAVLSGGAPLPAWLAIDGTTGRFTGTPGNADVAVMQVEVTASDGEASAVAVFDLTVANVNDAPTVINPIPLQAATEEIAFSYTFPLDTFEDIDAGAVLAYTAAPLPGWLAFDASARKFSGIPLNADVGTHDIVVTATDQSGFAAATPFRVTVANVNDPPVLVTPIPDGGVNQHQLFSFPPSPLSAYFNDVDAGDVLTYNVAVLDGVPWPTWLVYNSSTLTFGGTPDLDVDTVTRFRVTATDGSGTTASDEFQIQVRNVNDNPTLYNAISDQLAKEDSLFTFVIPVDTFDDQDGDTLSYAVSTLPAWLAFAAATGTFSGTPANDDVGAYDLTVTATDPFGLFVTDSFRITVENVNDAPTVKAPVSDQIAVQDIPFEVTVSQSTFEDVDNDELSFSVSGVPGWLTYNAATLSFIGTPGNSDVGSYDITVTATDPFPSSVSDTFQITVKDVNDAPTVLNPISGQTATEDLPFSYTVPSTTFEDIDGDPLTYTASIADGGEWPSWLAFDEVSRVFSGTPGNEDVALYNVVVTASDSVESSSTTFLLNVLNVNDPPVLKNPMANQGVMEDSSFTYAIPATTFEDIDAADYLTYNVAVLGGVPWPSEWLSYNATTRTFSGTPANENLGSWDFRVTATDQSGLFVSDDFRLTVTNTNDTPEVASGILDVSATEEVPFSYSFPENAFTDPDGDALTYTAVLDGSEVLPLWLSFDGVTRTFSGTPTNDEVGEFTISVKASDLFVSVTTTFKLTVVDVNDPPTVVNSIAQQFAVEDEPFSFAVPPNIFYDMDKGDILAYAATLEGGAPLTGWLSFDPLTSTFSGTPGNDDIANYNVVVTATDGNGTGASVSTTFSVTVEGANDPPTIAGGGIPDSAVDEDTPVNYDVSTYFVDIDPGDSMTFTALLATGEALPDWLTIDAASGVFSGTPRNEDVALYDVAVTATDAAGEMVIDLFTLEVRNVNDPPVIDGQSDIRTIVNTPVTIALDALLVTDVDNLYPNDFSLTVAAGTGYTLAGNTVTPEADFSGEIYANLFVNDGVDDSNVFSARILVVPPVLTSEISNMVEAGSTHSGYIDAVGTMMTWGSDGSGQLGYNTVDGYSFTPLPVDAGVTWSRLALGGYHTVAIDTDGYLWGWGRNTEGQLGDGTLDDRSSPVQIGSASDWVAVGAGTLHTVGLKSNGTLWSWGKNLDGQLGLGDKTNRSTPTEIAGFDPDNPWVSFTCGANFTLAIKRDGTLWGWGDNTFGQLGGATTASFSSVPVRIGGGDTIWTSVAAGYDHALAIDVDGNLWSWGQNDWGQLGNGTTSYMSTLPSQVTTGTVWSVITAGNYFSAAIDADGGLWSWGSNEWGQLGNGTGGLGFREVLPVTAGLEGETWTDISGGAAHLLALRSDGQIFAWGSNQNGQLATGDTSDTVSRTIHFDSLPTHTKEADLLITGYVDGVGISVTTGIRIELGYVDALLNYVTTGTWDASYDSGTGGWNVTISFDPTYQGEYLLTATASGTDLYSALAREYIVFDQTEPLQPALTSSGTLSRSNSVTWTWSTNFDAVSDSDPLNDGNGYYRFKLDSDVFDDATETGVSSVTHTADGLTEGLHTLYVQERDDAGNWSVSSSFAVTVDTVAPPAPLVSGIAQTNAPDPVLNWTSAATLENPGSGIFRWKLDSSLFDDVVDTGSTETSHTFVALSEGLHTLYVQERDEAGSWSESAAFIMNVDRTPPSLTINVLSPTNDIDQTMMIVSDATSFEVTSDTSAIPNDVVYDFMWWNCDILGLEQGANNITVTAYDGAGNSTTKTVGIYLNSAPVGTFANPPGASEDSLFTYPIPADLFTDPDGDPLTLSVSGVLPSWLSFVQDPPDSGTWKLEGTPTNSDVGSVGTTLSATDPLGLSASAVVRVSVNNTNDPPEVVNAIPDQLAEENVSFAYRVPDGTFADVDLGDSLVLTASLVDGSPLSASGWLNFDSATLEFSGLPSNDHVGTVDVKVTAKDTTGATVDDTFVITVLNADDPPVITGQVPLAVVEDTSLTIAVADLVISDPDSTVFTLTLNGGTNYTVTGNVVTPVANFNGTLVVPAVVSDGVYSSNTFDLTVDVTPVNDPPSITGTPNAIAFPGRAYSFTPQASDAEGTPLIFSLIESPADALIDPVTGAFSWTPSDADLNGVFTVTISASDGELSADYSFELTVSNASPTLGTVSVNSAWTSIPFTENYSDPIVMTGLVSSGATDSGVVRVSNVSSSGFSMKFQEWDYHDGVHGVEDVPYLVLNKGRYDFDDGSIWVAGSFNLTDAGSYQMQSFGGNTFPSTPRIFLTLQTENDFAPIVVHARNVTTAGFEAAMFHEEAGGAAHAEETVAYLAVYSPTSSGTASFSQRDFSCMLQTAQVDSIPTPVASWRAILQEEQSIDYETTHAKEDVDVMILDGLVFGQVVSDNELDTAVLKLQPTELSAGGGIEWGSVTITGPSPVQVPLGSVYGNPVVIAWSMAADGTSASLAQVISVTGTSFEIQSANWPGTDTTGMTVFYMVAETGVQSVAGLRVQAGTVDIGGVLPSWQRVPFNAGYTSAPAVFVSPQTMNEADDSFVNRVQNLSGRGFDISLQESPDGDGIHGVETVGWIAIEKGIGVTPEGQSLMVFSASSAGDPTFVDFSAPFMDYFAGGVVSRKFAYRYPRLAALLGNGFYEQSFAGSQPLMIAGLSTAFDTNPAFLSASGLVPTGVDVFIQENQAAGTNGLHGSEEVSILIAH